jgi:hypothetical protein
MKKLFPTLLISIFAIFFYSSCTLFMEDYDDKAYEVIGLKEKQLSLVFSGNINGETHPCGCRHFPLGGLPQVAGQMSLIDSQGDRIYVDAGDTFFPAAKIPDTRRRSLTFAAENVAKALDLLGLKYYVPGDQDFAAGIEWLDQLSKKVKFHFLIANLKDEKAFKHKKWVGLKKGPHQFFLTGVTLPSVLPKNVRNHFADPVTSLQAVLKEIKSAGYDPKNKFHRLILISHSGLGEDESYAKKFPNFDWVIGSHTQSFIRVPRKEGKTKIVQVLSRNHYLGEIKLSLTGQQSEDAYEIYEVRDELKDKLKPNPFIAFLDNHKKEADRMQSLEQKEMALSSSATHFQTAQSCTSCHQEQSQFWQGTAHSIAYATLLNAGEGKNLQCLKCHTFALGEAQGFGSSENIVHFDDVEKEELETKREAYWNELNKSIKDIKSVRKLSSKKIKKYSAKWLAQDEKHGVSTNFSNVQCLNCHGKDNSHPFEENPPIKLNAKEKYATIQKKCLTCHDPDQSPEWYIKKENGLPGDLDHLKFKGTYKKLSCPKFKGVQ